MRVSAPHPSPPPATALLTTSSPHHPTPPCACRAHILPPWIPVAPEGPAARIVIVIIAHLKIISGHPLHCTSPEKERALFTCRAGSSARQLRMLGCPQPAVARSIRRPSALGPTRAGPANMIAYCVVHPHPLHHPFNATSLHRRLFFIIIFFLVMA